MMLTALIFFISGGVVGYALFATMTFASDADDEIERFSKKEVDKCDGTCDCKDSQGYRAFNEGDE